MTFRFLIMKKLLIILLTLSFLPWQSVSAASLAEKLSGRILLQVESYGRAWYVEPDTNTRYYLKDGDEAYKLMRQLGLGITNQDLEKVPTEPSQNFDPIFLEKVRGKILLQVENHGEAWYVNPTNNLRYYLKDGQAAYEIMRSMSLGITNVNLATIPVTNKQIVQDTTFDDIAYVKTTNGKIVLSKNANQILPPASMTKLMTALVLRELPDYDNQKLITINQNDLSYPIQLVGDDSTSEIPLELNGVYSVADLWVAMLVASSNQATIALVDNSGLTRQEFINLMNKKAQALGLEKTIFVDPTGLDAHNLTTPYEMSIIANEAFKYKDISTATKLRNYTMYNRANGKYIVIQDRNLNLQKFTFDAAKTGYLIEAQRCISIKQNDSIIVIMHAHSLTERDNIISQLQ